MSAKLHINISQGMIDVEGDPDFVREIYADFREHLLAAPGLPQLSTPLQDAPDAASAEVLQKSKARRRATTRKKAGPQGDVAGAVVVADSPRLDKSLDTSKLPSYYQQFEAKNNPEKILVFLRFLIDQLGVNAPNTDQVYTCYERADERIPKVFSQAFRDASGRKFGYIDYNSATDIRITTHGNNYFKFELKRKASE